MVRGYTSLETTVEIQKWFGGLPPKRGYQKLYMVYATFIQLACGYGFIIPQIIYCVLNFQDTNTVLDSIYIIVEVMVAMFKCSFVLINYKLVSKASKSTCRATWKS